MEEELQCPVCLRLFADPVILPCFHNVCYNCAEFLIHKNGNTGVDLPPAYNLNHTSPQSVEADKVSFMTDPVLSDTDSGYSGASGNGRVTGNDRNGSPIIATPLPAPISTLSSPIPKTLLDGSSVNGVSLPVLPQSIRCLTCPICHRTLFLDERGAEGLPKNALMKTIVEKYSKTNANKPPITLAAKSDGCQQPVNQITAKSNALSPNHAVPALNHAPNVSEMCQLCEKSPADLAVTKCLQCDINYCSACKDKYHPSRGPLAKHTFTNLKPVPPEVEKPPVYRHNKFQPLPSKPLTKNGFKLSVCTQHATEKTSLYCETCRVSLCVQCREEGRHKTHSLKPIGALFKQLKSDLSCQMSSLSNKARQAKDLVVFLRGSQSQIERCAVDLEAQAVAQCNHLIEAVERKRDELIQKINREKELKCKIARDQLQQCTLKLKQTTGLLEYCIEVVKDNDVAAFLQISQSLSERVMTMEKQWSLRALQPRVTPEFDLEFNSAPIALAIDQIDFIHTKIPDKPVVKIEHFGCADNSVTLSWCLPTNSQAADGFKLEMDNGSNGPFKEVYCGSETLCTVDGLRSNSVYKARVRSFNKAGDGPYSEMMQLQTSEATNFEMDPYQGNNDVVLSEHNRTVTCRNSEHKVVFGSIGFTRGIHYWEFSIDRCSNRPGPSFGVATSDVDRSQMLGKDTKGWSLYAPDENHSWFLHGSQHVKRFDFPLKVGNKVGLLLNLNQNCISYYINGILQNTALSLNAKTPDSNQIPTYYPAVSLNQDSQVTLYTGMPVPVPSAVGDSHRSRSGSASSGDLSMSIRSCSPRLKSFSSYDVKQSRGTPPPPPIRRSSSSTATVKSDGEVSTTGSDPTPIRSLGSFFLRKTEQRVVS